MSERDTELGNRRPRLRSGWDDADSVKSLQAHFCSRISFQQRFLVKFFFVVYSEKGFNVVQVPTAVLFRGLGLHKDKRSICIVYEVGLDGGY